MPRLLTVLAALAALAAPPAAQQAPVADFADLLESIYYDDTSGFLSVQSCDLVFAPEGPCRAEIAVADRDGNVLLRESFSEMWGGRVGVFASMQMDKICETTLTDPGVYFVIVLWDGEQITRMPLVVKQTGAGDDPFDPTPTFAFDGLWRQLGYVTWSPDETYGDVPEFTFWTGGLDLAEGATKDHVVAVLSRDGETVAHGKRRSELIREGHFHRSTLRLFHPHEEGKEHTTEFFRRDDLADGSYELKVARESDMTLIRNYRFVVRDGELVPHERSDLGYEPRADLLAPRVSKVNSTSLEFVEATWIESR